MKRYKITKDADMLAPNWLADRINYKTVKFLYGVCDGAEILKGVKKMTRQQKSAIRFALTVGGYQ